MAGFETPQEKLAREKSNMAQVVRNEFAPGQLQAGQTMNGPGAHAVERVYGGTMSTRPQELSLVKAMRPTPSGEWVLGTGVVHRVHPEDDTLTIQFVPDQHRLRLPLRSVSPILDIEPVYPKIRLGKGEPLPTRSQVMQRELAAEEHRRQLGLTDGQPLPGQDMEGLRPGEWEGKNGNVKMMGDHWGIPVWTIDALKNRSIPNTQVTGAYGCHFYTELYQNNFYASPAHRGLDVAAQLQQEKETKMVSGKSKVVSHIYIPLQGPQLQLDVDTGVWNPSEDYDD